MTLTIDDTTMTSDQNPHTARQAPGRPQQWEVSWLPCQVLDRNTAITAMILADTAGQGDLHEGHRLWPHIQSWAAELGLTPPDAIARASQPPRDLDPGQERASGQPGREGGRLSSQPDTSSRSPGSTGRAGRLSENGTENADHEIITTPGFPEPDSEAAVSLDDSPIPYTLTSEGDAAARADLAEAWPETGGRAMYNLDLGVPWTPRTAEEHARWHEWEAAENDRWRRLDRQEQIRRQLEAEARHLYPEQFPQAEYVGVSWSPPGSTGIQRLHSPVKAKAEPEAEL
jgi:hypothetical protein